MSRVQKIISDILTFAVFNLSIRVRGFVFIPLISGVLGTADFGAYTMLIAIVNTFQLFFSLGLPEALVLYSQSEKYEMANLYYSYAIVIMPVGLAMGGVIYVFSEPLSAYTLGTEEYAIVYQTGAILVLFQMLTRLGLNYFRAQSRIKVFSGLQATRAYLSIGAVSYVVLIQGGGIGTVVLAVIVVEGMIAIGTNAYPVIQSGFTLPTFPDLREHLEYAIPLSFTSLASTLESRVDRVLIGFWLGASAVGVYTIAYQIGVAISMYMTPIRETFFPEFSKHLEKGDYQRCGDYLQAGAKYFVVIAVPTVGGIYLIGTSVVRVLVGPDSSAPSAYLMLIIASGIVLNGLAGIFETVLNANKRTGTLFVIRVFGTLSNIVLNVLLIPRYGIIGAAAATLITYTVTLSLISYTIRSVPVPSLGVTALRTTGCAAVMIGLVEYVGIEFIPAVIIISAVVYCAGILLTGEIRIGDLRAAIG